VIWLDIALVLFVGGLFALAVVVGWEIIKAVVK